MSEMIPDKEKLKAEIWAEIDNIDRRREYLLAELQELNWNQPFPTWRRFCEQHPDLCLEELNDAYVNLISWHRRSPDETISPLPTDI